MYLHNHLNSTGMTPHYHFVDEHNNFNVTDYSYTTQYNTTSDKFQTTHSQNKTIVYG